MKLFISILLFFCANMIYAATATTMGPSPVGYWQTIDDVTGKPKAVVQIWETPDKILQGKIVKVFATSEEKKRCVACKGDKHNQPILGMLIMDQLKPNDHHTWDNGNILDPKNGKIYRCTVQLAEQGRKLNVHGYIGLPLFGRTQTWIKMG